MTDLLSPETVREIMTLQPHGNRIHRLCRDYLTLWDKYEDLLNRFLEHE